MLLLFAGLAGSVGASVSSWKAGTPAAETGEVLQLLEPVVLDLPASLRERIQRETLIFYFSPSCPHCVEAAPGIGRLAEEMGEDLAFLGISTSNSTEEEFQAFAVEHGISFPIVLDTDREFVRATGVRSTPVVMVVRPTESGIQLVDGYSPWFQGAGTILQMRRSEDPFSAFTGQYVGRNVCGSCHFTEGLSWSMTHHSVAYATLYMRERAADPECVGCHVTGLGEGGFTMGDHRSPLAGVTCEACHSAGGPHDGQAVDARESCVGCHDADHSIAFTVEKGLPHIDHYRAIDLEEAEVQARWQALSRGEADRPLLAFPTGKNLGAEACLSCHAQEHERWKDSPHGRAMAHLGEEEAGQVDCVRCHATPMDSGPEAGEVAGFRTGESVGCESCHGPGEQHIAAPGTENILGLGSSCPECVIEEVCTSCHTPQWDAEWELSTRLEAVKAAH